MTGSCSADSVTVLHLSWCLEIITSDVRHIIFASVWSVRLTDGRGGTDAGVLDYAASLLALACRQRPESDFKLLGLKGGFMVTSR